MKFKKIQRLIDKAIAVLSDHDEKREEERYKKLQDAIIEAQDFVEKNNYSAEIEEELKKELNECIDAFKESKIVFILFLIFLCGLLFIGIFYISYSHFYDHWYDGGHFRPPYRPTKTHDVTTTASEKTTEKTTSKDKTTTKSFTSSTTTTSEIITTTPSVIEPDPEGAFVTVIFDTSTLIDLDNIYPVDDNVGINTTPTTWKLDSTLSNGSKDYIITYAINFVDKIDDIPQTELLDVSKLKYQLLVKNSNSVVYDSGVQLMKDYPEVESGVRQIIVGESYKNDETLDFELRMWLDSSTDNSQQGKKYRFDIDVEATYEFVE